MKLTFRNSRDSKNIHNFIVVLKLMQDFLEKSNNKSVYFVIQEKGISLMTSMEPMMGHFNYNTFICYLKKQAYHLSGNLESIVYCVDLDIILKFINVKMEKKINFLTFIFGQDQPNDLQIHYSSSTAEQIELEGHMGLKISVQQQTVPMNPREITDDNILLIQFVTFSEQICKDIEIDDGNIWIECSDKGLIFRTTKINRCVAQNTVTLDKLYTYDYLQLKKDLLMKIFINLMDNKLMKHLTFCGKYKKKCKSSLILIFNPMQQDQILMSYLLLQTQNELSEFVKIIPCFLSTAVRNMQTVNIPTTKIAENNLLKAEDNLDTMRKAILNRHIGIDQEMENADKLLQERMPHGKIQEGEETFTKKRKFQVI